MRRDKVVIMPYQEIWSKQFQFAKQELKFYLGETALCIHHIGSTSIPGMPSKNRIDIQVGVESISQAYCDKINIKLQPIGFPAAYLSNDHLPPFEVNASDWEKIYLPGQVRKWDFKANIHIRKMNAKNFDYALLFRDYLRSHNEAALSYAQVKQALAKYTFDNRDAYSEIKDPVCDLIMIDAKRWAAAR
jgi:GrpB-like predicted nucleotidyltransferase (UPF0157 family)